MSDDICTCGSCGYNWRRGENGEHSCVQVLQRRIAELEEGRVVVQKKITESDLEKITAIAHAHYMVNRDEEGAKARFLCELNDWFRENAHAIPADRVLADGQVVVVDREDIAKTFKAGFEFAKDWRNNPSNSEYVNEFFDLRAQARKDGG